MVKVFEVAVKVTDMKIFKNLSKIAGEFINDERVSEEVRNEYAEKLKELTCKAAI